MKLAEALNLRSDLQRKATDLKDRIETSALVQDGDKPIEDTTLLLKEFDSVFIQLSDLIFKINKTNLLSVADGKTLTQLMADREVLAMRHRTINEIIDHCSSNDRYSRNEIKYVCTLNLSQLRKEREKYAKEYRLTELQIQERNWELDLLD